MLSQADKKGDKKVSTKVRYSGDYLVRQAGPEKTGNSATAAHEKLPKCAPPPGFALVRGPRVKTRPGGGRAFWSGRFIWPGLLPRLTKKDGTLTREE